MVTIKRKPCLECGEPADPRNQRQLCFDCNKEAGKLVLIKQKYVREINARKELDQKLDPLAKEKIDPWGNKDLFINLKELNVSPSNSSYILDDGERWEKLYRLKCRLLLRRSIPSSYHVHHLDNNHRNNEAENLALMPEVAHLLMHEGARILQRTGNVKELEILFQMANLKEMLPLYLECYETNDYERFIKEANGMLIIPNDLKKMAA